MVVLKGILTEHSGDAGQTLAAQTNADIQSAVANDQAVEVSANASNAAASPEQLRAAAIANELDQINQLQGNADGSNNPTIISALLDKVVNPEAEVRAAALDALKQLNDTNAVPGLQKTVDLIKDPRGKVAVLDTIDYLKLPNVTPDPPPDDTNNPDMTNTTTRRHRQTSP